MAITKVELEDVQEEIIIGEDNAFERLYSDSMMGENSGPPKNIEELLSNFKEAYLEKDARSNKKLNMEIDYLASSEMNTHYSFAVISRKISIKNISKVGYSIILFGETGNSGVLPTEVIKGKFDGNNINPAMAMNKVIYDYGVEIVRDKFNVKDSDIIACGEIIVYETFDTTNIADCVKLAFSISNLINEITIKDGFGVNTDKFFRSSIDNFSQLTINHSFINKDGQNTTILGNPKYIEWKTEIVASSDQQEEINKTNGRMTLGSCVGYVSMIMGEVNTSVNVPIPGSTYTQPQNIAKPMMIPTINTTLSDPKIPTMASTLLQLVGCLPIVPKWSEILANNLTKGRNPGAVNILIDINNDKLIGKAPKKLLIDPKLNLNAKIREVERFFVPSPLFVIDISAFAFGSEHLAPFSIASKGVRDSNIVFNKIIKGAMELTKGNFNKDVQIKDVFARKSIVIPDGYYINDKGIPAPYDMLDTLRFSELTNDESLVKRYANALSGKVDTNSRFGNSYDEINDIYAMLIEQGVKMVNTGMKERIFLTKDFLLALKDGIEESGLSIIDPEYTGTLNEANFANIDDMVDAGFGNNSIQFRHEYGRFNHRGRERYHNRGYGNQYYR